MGGFVTSRYAAGLGLHRLRFHFIFCFIPLPPLLLRLSHRFASILLLSHGFLPKLSNTCQCPMHFLISPTRYGTARILAAELGGY